MGSTERGLEVPRRRPPTCRVPPRPARMTRDTPELFSLQFIPGLYSLSLSPLFPSSLSFFSLLSLLPLSPRANLSQTLSRHGLPIPDCQVGTAYRFTHMQAADNHCVIRSQPILGADYQVWLHAALYTPPLPGYRFF